MSHITFLSNSDLMLASGNVVFSRDETLHLDSVADYATRLSVLFGEEQRRVKEAESSAYEQGFEKGQAEGYDAALGHIAVKLLALSKEADQVRDQLERTAGDLALDIVQKIAEHIAPQKTLTALAATAARQLVSKEPVILRVSVQNLEGVRDTVVSSPHFAKRITEVSGDPSLSDDECVLETEFGQIKAGLDVQLKSLREHFSADG